MYYICVRDPMYIHKMSFSMLYLLHKAQTLLAKRGIQRKVIYVCVLFLPS